jgi:peptidoglycan hydrolase-like protein with peptidoglycan-binding domain
MPASRPSGGYEPAIPGGGSVGSPALAPQIRLPPIMPSLNPGVQAGGASAREHTLRYYVYLSVRAADGDLSARLERDLYGLNHRELVLARRGFAERSRKDGKLGFLRLGIAQLGPDAYDIAAKEGLMVPFCRPNDFVMPDKRQAFVSFTVASECDTAEATRANDWLDALAEFEEFSEEEKDALRGEASGYLATDTQACFAQLATESPPAPGAVEEDDTIDVPPPPSSPALGLRGAGPSDQQVAAAYSRQLLNLGDAALAEGRLNRARRWWLRSIEAGKAVGAQASIMAQKRIQTHTLTCHFTGESVKAISRDYKDRSGDLIHLRVIQEALRALGHYDGPVNGTLSVVTRAAIRKFQREMAFDETETLTPLQTVYVICNAAETARDLSSTNALGIMYVTGLGVERNVDLALEWLRLASTRRFPDATFNLALIYGTGIVLNSYRLCDIPQDIEQADQYLREAANQNQPVAAEMWRRHGSKTPIERWKAIEADLMKHDERGVFKKTKEELPPLGKNCKPTGDADSASPSTF